MNTQSISTDRTFTQALSDFGAAEAVLSAIDEGQGETPPAFTAAELAVQTAWDAVIAAADAFAARQVGA